MTEYGADWYDEKLPGSRAMLPLFKSPWFELYQQASRMIWRDEEVVDLGCGTGRFIELLALRGHRAKVTGIDFSSASLEEAMRANANFGRSTFVRADLNEWRPESKASTYTCFEVLEHLVEDVQLVAKIPAGKRFIFSVPNYKSQAHVRVFFHPSEIFERYGDLLRFDSWRVLRKPNTKNVIHLCSSVRYE